MKMTSSVVILNLIFLFNTLLLVTVSNGQEEENTVIGKIVEMAISENIIQVGNRNYIVEKVSLDYGTDETPIIGRFSNLKLGEVVKIYEGDKKEGFWEAKEVVLYLGEKREEILKELE